MAIYSARLLLHIIKHKVLLIYLYHLVYRNLVRAFRLSERNQWLCIGLRYDAKRSNWFWVNGELANSSEILWRAGEPDLSILTTESSGPDPSKSEEQTHYCVAIEHSTDVSKNARAFIKACGDDNSNNYNFFGYGINSCNPYSLYIGICEWEY